MKFAFIITILVSIPLFADAVEQERKVMDRLRVDIAELKGPPSVEQVIKIQQERADDLLMVINSGRYEGMRLNYLKKVHNRMLLSPKPTQEEINKTHVAMIEQMQNNQKNNFRTNSSNQNNNLRDKQMQTQESRQIMRRNND